MIFQITLSNKCISRSNFSFCGIKGHSRKKKKKEMKFPEKLNFPHNQNKTYSCNNWNNGALCRTSHIQQQSHLDATHLFTCQFQH